MGPEGAIQLFDFLHDPVTDVRLAAVRALGGIGDPQAVEPLCNALKDADKDVRQAAAGALGKLGAPAVESLIAALQDRAVAAHAAQALGSIVDPRAIPALIDALRDENYGIRSAAVEAVGRFNGMALEPLIATLHDPNKDTRRAASDALDILGWQPASDATERNIGSPNRIGTAAPPTKRPPSIRWLAMLKDGDPDVRKACVLCLGKIGDRRAFDPLVAAL